MKATIDSSFTPQNKLVGVHNKFGNTNITNRQGRTRVIYDSLPLDGRTELRFFENASSRQYPFTNVGAEGNRLNVGESLVVEKVYFAIIGVDESGVANSFNNIGAIGPSEAWYLGEWSFLIANNQVIKQLPWIPCFAPQQNVTAQNQEDQAFSTYSDIVIPPLLEYVLTYRVNAYTAQNTRRLACFIEGTAGILAPQTTF